jgi:hypothetical protein
VTVPRVRRGPDPDLILRFPDGFYGAIAASWTDYAVESGIAPFSDLPPLLDPLGLYQMAQLVAPLRNRHRSNEAETCTPNSSGYADRGRSCPAVP